MLDDEMTLAQLARSTEERVEDLRRWQSLGLIEAQNETHFGHEAFHRVLLIRFFLRRGVPLTAIVRANEQQALLWRCIRRMFPAGCTRTYSLEQAAAKLGLSLDDVRRFWQASGLADQGEWLDAEDTLALRSIKEAIAGGFPEEALLQLLRVYADALMRVAEAEQRLFHFYVYAPLKAQGLWRDAVEDSMTDRFIPLSEPNVLYFHRKGWQRACREDALLHLEEDTGVALRGELPAQLRAAVAFVDISGFTLLADAMGDAAAAEVLGRFSHLVREAAAQREGRIVKQIGDAFMLVFPNPRQAVACLIDIDHRAAEQHQFPALRSAAHWGDVLYREGDYLGANVNIAARLASDAERHQVLVTAAVRTAAAALPEVEFTRLGRKCLKGVSEEIEVFEVRRRAGGVLPRRAVDPVCGMELNAEDIAAELTIDGRQQAFCSHNCLQRFVAAPARYKVEPQRGTPPR